MTRLVACKVLCGKCEFDVISAYFLKESGGRKGVPKITFFVFFGALFCLTFCHFFMHFVYCICYAHLWVALGAMSLASICVRLALYNSMKRGVTRAKTSSFAFTVSVLANGDSEIAVLAIFSRFTMDMKTQLWHCGRWCQNWHQIEVWCGGILDVAFDGGL